MVWSWFVLAEIILIQLYYKHQGSLNIFNYIYSSAYYFLSVRTRSSRVIYPGWDQKAPYLFDLSNCPLLLAVIIRAVAIQSLRNEISIMKCNINALNASAVVPNQFHSSNFAMRNYWNYYCPYVHTHIYGRECESHGFFAVWGIAVIFRN